MLPFDRYDVSKRQRIRVACAYLFSRDMARDDDFIKRLTIEEVRKAFRLKAKQYHPDVLRGDSQAEVRKREDRFKMISDAYQLLTYTFQEEQNPYIDIAMKGRKIIAVGGAKGGIGKSTFSSNLGVILSALGHRTVLVDMDLGGANLHLYLGQTFLERDINDYILKRVNNIEEILTETRHGPLLIGGDSSRLGAANITFQHKMKLIRALRKIDAEYVVIDLGGDTAFNIIDFFLMADFGIVLTTCDPASYLDAFNFLKVCLYRKLNRVFGQESPYHARRDHQLEELIQRATDDPEGCGIKTVGKLLKVIREEQYHNFPLMEKVVADYSPNLVVNRADRAQDAMDIARRIQQVSSKMLGIRVGFLGSLPTLREIELSARDLVPIVARDPEGAVARNMKQMIKRMLTGKAAWLL